MGWFDDDEDDTPKAEPMGPPVTSAQDPVVRDYLHKKYFQAADDSDVRAAEKDAQKSRQMALIMKGIGQIATADATARTGKQYMDNDAFRMIGESAQDRVASARQARKDRMDSVVAEDHMQQQGLERTRGGQEFAHKQDTWKREEGDRLAGEKTDSPEARSMQALAGKMTGKDPSTYSNLSAVQLKKMLPSLEHLYKIDQDAKNRADARAASGTKTQPFKYKDKDGNERLGKLIGGNLQQSSEDPIVETAGGDAQFKKLAPENQEIIKDLSRKSANKFSIANQIDAVLNNWDTLSDDEKLAQGNQLLKVLNSTEGSDAIGAEEKKRLGAKLEFALGNFTNGNPTQFGRDLPGFKKDAQQTSANIRAAIDSNSAEIDRRYGREPHAVAARPAAPRPAPSDGTAFASPADLQDAMVQRARGTDTESKIQAFMKKNGITDRDQAIKILRENKRL